MNAVGAEFKGALEDARGLDDEPPAQFGALNLCQAIQDAIDVLKFAVERGDDAR